MTVDLAPVFNLSESIGFALLAMAISFLWAPFLTNILYRYNITAGRRGQFDVTLTSLARREKLATPVMGGLLVIVTIAVITILFNWERTFTWVPIGVMLLAAGLGALDDLLNIFGSPRRSKKLSHVLRLIRVHRHVHMRIWYTVSFPWTLFKRTAVWLSTHPGKGIQVHEKLLLQGLAGGIAAWWIYFKLGANWHALHVPFLQSIDIGIFFIPLVIIIVIFTANAVNIADGMDGLAGGMLIPTFASLTLLSWIYGFPEMTILNATTVGALVTYTYFNVKPARFQMGDVGSLGLGALLAINALVINAVIILPFFAFMFFVEAISVIIQISSRYLFGKKVFKMAPIHHHFELLGWSEEKIVMRFWILHFAFVLLGIWLGLQ